MVLLLSNRHFSFLNAHARVQQYTAVYVFYCMYCTVLYCTYCTVLLWTRDDDSRTSFDVYCFKMSQNEDKYDGILLSVAQQHTEGIVQVCEL